MHRCVAKEKPGLIRVINGIPVRAVQSSAIEWRRHHCVVDRVKQPQLFIIETVRDHLPLLKDQIALMRCKCIKLDKEEDQSEAINAEDLPEDS